MSCGPTAKKSEVPVEVAPPTHADAAAFDEAMAAGDAAWAERGDRQRAEAAVTAWRRAVKLKATEARAHLMLARGLFFLAHGWLVDESGDEAKKTFEAGYMSAERALLLMSSEFREARERDASVKDASVLVDAEEELEALLWYVTNLGAWVNLEGKRAGLANRDTLLSVHKLILERAPDLHYRAADRFYGAYYSAAPSMFGGSINKSADHFDEALSNAPNFPGNYLVMAEQFAVRTDDKLMFEQLIGRVVDAKPCGEEKVKPCITPELENEFKVAKRRAAILAKRKAELFD
jgi:hypothetical protein